MATTHFSGPVNSANGFQGDVTATNVTATNVALTAAAGTASNAAAFSAGKYLTFTANGVTVYIPCSTATW